MFISILKFIINYKYHIGYQSNLYSI